MKIDKRGLPIQAKELLRRVPTEPDRITLANLVEVMGWSQTDVNQIMEMLIRAGWVESMLSPGGDPAGGPGIAYSVPSRLTDAS